MIIPIKYLQDLIYVNSEKRALETDLLNFRIIKLITSCQLTLLYLSVSLFNKC